ncbi:MAG TPA: 3-hydroxyacyl-CoA dehydrogenase family protein [Chitinophagaceae bacterium]|nr:3-hydroxyacyl-CoA dehydrogenase family protein [Chitinophagaceae bacterium]
MRLAVLTNGQLKEELLSTGINESCKIDWLNSSKELSSFTDADAVIDLLFEENGYDVSYLNIFLAKPVFVNSMNKTVAEIGLPVIRINAWPGFLKRNIAEVSSDDRSNKNEAEKILSLLNRQAEWIPDVKGFISARVVSMIINEAYFTLEENVSTKAAIDIAMKLGTNYPYGPFEWSRKIGLKNIAALLTELFKDEKRYQPADLLLKEATGQ